VLRLPSSSQELFKWSLIVGGFLLLWSGGLSVAVQRKKLGTLKVGKTLFFKKPRRKISYFIFHKVE